MNAIPPIWTKRLGKLRAEPSRDLAGDAARLARVERTRVEMLAQGEAIAATLAATEGPIAALSRDPRVAALTRLVVVGCGDSWFAGQLARPVVEAALGLPCEAAQAYEHALWSGTLSNAGALALGISAGGNTPAVMTALEQARKQGAMAIGVSNTLASPILTAFDGALPVMALRKGWPTQSTAAAVALIAGLAMGLGAARGRNMDALAKELMALPGGADTVMAETDAAAAAAAMILSACPLVIVTGSGPDFAAAQVGAAKIRELCPIHAFALPLEEMHHYRLPKQGDGLVILSSAAATRDRALDTALVARAEGARSIALLSEPDSDMAGLVAGEILAAGVRGSFAGLLACMPLHALAYHLAIRREALGLGAAW